MRSNNLLQPEFFWCNFSAPKMWWRWQSELKFCFRLPMRPGLARTYLPQNNYLRPLGGGAEAARLAPSPLLPPPPSLPHKGYTWYWYLLHYIFLQSSHLNTLPPSFGVYAMKISQCFQCKFSGSPDGDILGRWMFRCESVSSEPQTGWLMFGAIHGYLKLWSRNFKMLMSQTCRLTLLIFSVIFSKM